MTTQTATANPCDPHTLIGPCAGNCGRRLHRHRPGAPYKACDDGHPTADGGYVLCPRCRRAARTVGDLDTYPKISDHDDPPSVVYYIGSQRWREHAVCRDQDPEMFFPVGTTGPTYRAQVAEAKAVCHRCPVQAECLTEALARIPYGIAGGLTEGERRTLAQRGAT